MARNEERVIVGATRKHRAYVPRPEPSQILDHVADAFFAGELSREACHLILAWWTTPDLTPPDMRDLGVSRGRLREAIMFLQALPEPLQAMLGDAIPAAQAPVLLPVLAHTARHHASR